MTILSPSRQLHSITSVMGCRLAEGALERASTLPTKERRSLLAICELMEDLGGTWAPEAWCGHVAAGTRKALKHQRAAGLEPHYLAGRLQKERRGPQGCREVYQLTPAGFERLKAERKGKQALRPATRPPRIDQASHHLLTIETSIDLLEAYGAEFSRLLGDEDLRSRKRTGQAAGADQGGTLADGKLWYLHPEEPRLRTVMIEVISGKYSDDMMRGKVSGLRGDEVVFSAPTRAAQERCARVTGLRPQGIGRSMIVPGGEIPRLPPTLEA